MNTSDIFREELIRNATKAELKFLAYLITNNIEHEFQKVIFCGHRFYIVDFWFPNNLIVEIDGKYHSDKEQKAKDKKRTLELRKMGYKVRRATNRMILNPDMFERFKIRFEKNVKRKKPRIRKSLLQ